jgi:L-threonylcarbamoyladenylate synthase
LAADAVARAVEALRAGEPVLLPTDGVYGLCSIAEREAPVARLYALKGREEGRPAAIIAASLEALFSFVPELDGRSGLIVRALLPGPYTLVLANPQRRYGWLNRARPDAIGVRVALLPSATQQVLDAVGAIAATSANLPGGRTPASLEDVPRELRAGAGAEIDAGRLPGTASTVIDFTGPEPLVLREGAGATAEGLARARRALGPH